MVDHINHYLRLKKINAMSQSSWQIGRSDLNAFVFPEQQTGVRFESVTALKYGTWFWMNKIQDRTQHWRSLLFVSVSLCLSYLFLYILTSKFIKNWKKISKQKKKPWICWIKCSPKNKCARQLWDIGFFLAL